MKENESNEIGREEGSLDERLTKIRNKAREYRSENTRMPTVSGVFDTIVGVFGLSGGAVLAFAGNILWPSISLNTTLLGIVLVVIGIMATVGGICALTRRKWAIAILGSVFASVFLFFLGIPAIIFTALSKNEFL